MGILKFIEETSHLTNEQTHWDNSLIVHIVTYKSALAWELSAGCRASCILPEGLSYIA